MFEKRILEDRIVVDQLTRLRGSVRSRSSNSRLTKSSYFPGHLGSMCSQPEIHGRYRITDKMRNDDCGKFAGDGPLKQSIQNRARPEARQWVFCFLSLQHPLVE